MLDARKNNLLELLIREYIKTAEPVGSNVLVDKHKLEISSATARNNMASLEKEGLIFQPHTSAGRIPSEKGFQYFVNNFLKKKELRLDIETDIEDKNEMIKIKNLAKEIAKISTETILVAFSKNDIYYTGISNFFRKPEFKNQNIIIEISDVIDKFDEIIFKIYNNISENPVILLGENNPFDKNCATILIRKNNIFFGIFGLIRMDYEKNLALINFVKNNI